MSHPRGSAPCPFWHFVYELFRKQSIGYFDTYPRSRSLIFTRSLPLFFLFPFDPFQLGGWEPFPTPSSFWRRQFTSSFLGSSWPLAILFSSFVSCFGMEWLVRKKLVQLAFSACGRILHGLLPSVLGSDANPLLHQFSYWLSACWGGIRDLQKMCIPFRLLPASETVSLRCSGLNRSWKLMPFLFGVIRLQRLTRRSSHAVLQIPVNICAFTIFWESFINYKQKHCSLLSTGHRKSRNWQYRCGGALIGRQVTMDVSGFRTNR